MNSVILRTLAPAVTVLMVVFSIFITLRGHNSPGGGFIGGLLAASGVALYALAFVACCACIRFRLQRPASFSRPPPALSRLFMACPT